jgi:HAE1 family hydrophobic/amphiphilic exporter-1
MILVVIVVFAFLLNFRATFIVAIAIPTSLVATFFAFYMFGFTINLLTLLALTVAIGLLVDDAIVVIEAIAKELEHGADPLTAAREGTRKVGLAVLAGTFATLAVFVPIAFMSGIVGRFFFQYGLAIVFSVSVSLIVALTLTPMLTSRWLRHSEPTALLKPIQSFWNGLDRVYGGIVNWCVKWRYLVIVLGFATLPIGGYFAALVPSGFTSNADRSEFQGTLELPLGIGITQARETAQIMSDALAQLPEVENVFVTAGAGARNALNQIDFLVSMTPKQSRDMTQEMVMALARQALSEAVPQARDIAVVEVPWISGGGITSFEIDLRMRGADLDRIDAYAQALMGDMDQTDFFADTQSSLNGGRPEVQVQFDRLRGGDMGVPANELAMVTRIAIGGADVSTFESDGHRYDVRLQLEDVQRQDLAALRQIQVRSRSGELVDLGNVSNIEIVQGLSQIDRQDRSRMISILTNTAPGVALGDASDVLESIIEARPPPAGITLTVEGQARRMQDSIEAIGFAFMLALIALYIVLSSQFNSFVQPLLIMITAPLSFSGAFAALYYADQEMSLFAQIGMLALMGIVMKNGILLVDRANQLREEGLDPVAAIRKACPERLRPVLMTAFSAIFGLIPVALAQSDGAEWRNALGFIIIGGLASSTVLTMLVLPSAYAAMADVGKGVSAIRTMFGGLITRQPNKTS